MNPGGNGNDHFEKDLEQVTDAYRDIHPDEPPAMLDQAVLNTARRAVRSKSVRPWNFGWIHAVTTAAVVVLGVAVVLQLPEKPALQQPIPATRESGTGLPDDYRRPAEIEDRQETAVDELEEAPTAQASFEDAGKSESFAEPADRQDAPVERERLQLRKAASPDRENARAKDDSLAGLPGDDSVTPETGDDADSMAEMKAAAQQARREMVEIEDPAPPPEGTAARPVSVATEPPPAEESAGQVAEIVVTGASRLQAEGDLATAEQDANEADARSQEVLRDERNFSASAIEEMLLNLPEEPEAWLERIRQLKEAGEQEAFEEELRAFMEAWPDYPLPEDLVADPAEGGP